MLVTPFSVTAGNNTRSEAFVMTVCEVEIKRVDMCGYMLYTSKQPTLYGARGFTICNISYISRM